MDTIVLYLPTQMHTGHYMFIISAVRMLHTLLRYILMFLDFKLWPCSECCILLFGWFPGIRILCADVSKHSVCSIFIGGVSKKNNQDENVGAFIREKVWLENSLSQSEGGRFRLFLSQTFSLINTPTFSSWLFFLLTPPMKMEQTECSEMSAYKIQMPGNQTKGRIQHFNVIELSMLSVLRRLFPSGTSIKMMSPCLFFSFTYMHFTISWPCITTAVGLATQQTFLQFWCQLSVWSPLALLYLDSWKYRPPSFG